MPKVGNRNFPYTPEGIAAAKEASMAIDAPVTGAPVPGDPIAGIAPPGVPTTGMPTFNAQDRSQMYYMGGKLEDKGYKKGGKVKK